MPTSVIAGFEHQATCLMQPEHLSRHPHQWQQARKTLSCVLRGIVIVIFALWIEPRRLVAQQSRALESQFDSVINAHFLPDEPGGVVPVVKRGQIVYERAFGLANLEWRVPMRSDAVFSLASLTKQFTAVAVLQLVEQGRLSLADTVGKFIPAYRDDLKSVTIEQLLTHTGGVPNAMSLGTLLALGRGG
jgi:CubicO group peptidase (beta-lactamase class C family)